MIYVDEDFYNRILREDERINGPWKPASGEQIAFNLVDDDFDPVLYELTYMAAHKQFASTFVDRVLSLTFNFYPHSRSKKKELKEALLQDGEIYFDTMSEIKDCYVEGTLELDECDEDPNSINMNEVTIFLRNRKLDYLLENYEEWLNRKISFENLYVESFYAGVFIKSIHKLLIAMIHEYYPVIKSLPVEKLDKIYAYITNDAWDIYNTIARTDSDELNDSEIILDLEDYEYDDLINYKGPKVSRDADGRIQRIYSPRNRPKPDKVPLLCRQCKYFNDEDPENMLCTVTRFSQKNSESFSCRAYEEYFPDTANKQ